MTFELALLAGFGVLVVLGIHSRLRTIDAKLDTLLRLQGIGAKGQLTPSDEVIALARNGETIQAMRRYRQESGADVKLAKAAIAHLQESGPTRAT